MKKTLSLVFLLSVTLFANEKEIFFNKSKENSLLCRAGYETYIKVSQKNSSIEKINGSLYFRFEKKDLYFPLAGCNLITE